MDSEARRTATTITLAGAKPVAKVVELDEARMVAALKRACEDLPIDVDQLRAELKESGDLPDVVSGALMPEALRQVAETLAVMRVSQSKDSKDVE
jgi:hypothetical protein